METIEGKIALITGASRGIGAAIAQSLAAEGATVVINYLSNDTKAEETKAAIDALGKQPAMLAKADVGNLEAVQEMFQNVTEQYGRLDILVNNAGTKGPIGSLESVSLEELQATMQTNFWGPMYTTRAVLPLMKKNKFGRLVYLSIELVDRPAIKLFGYGASKAALNALSNSVAVENGAYGITSNIITPGPTDTELNHQVAEIYKNDPSLMRDHFMIPGLAPAQAIGETVAMLCKNPHLTAQNIFVDNGYQRKYIIPRAKLR